MSADLVKNQLIARSLPEGFDDPGSEGSESKRKSQRGLTLMELIVAFTILMVLTMMAIPIARFRIRREHERDLRLALNGLRTAIDKYKDACDGGKIATTKIDTLCYPDSLDALVEGVKIANDPKGNKIRFLRRIPRDPFTHSGDSPRNRSPFSC